MSPPRRIFDSLEQGYQQVKTERQFLDRITGMSASEVVDGGHLDRLREIAASRHTVRRTPIRPNPQDRRNSQ